MRRRIIAFIIMVIALIVGYNYIYQDHRDIENEVAEFSVSSFEIAQLFSKDVKSAEQNFLNKTIEVSGLVSEINVSEITLDDKVFCQFSDGLKIPLDKNSKAKIKGRVIGYDDLLEQVKLDQCTIIE